MQGVLSTVVNVSHYEKEEERDGKMLKMALRRELKILRRLDYPNSM
jgi:hypothetical protein